MKWMLALGLFGALSLSAVGQGMNCGPCGSPCGPSTSTGVGAPPNMGAGRGDGENYDPPGRKTEIASKNDLLELIDTRYGGKPWSANNDPAVQEYLKQLNQTDVNQYSEIKDLLSQDHDYYRNESGEKDPTIERVPGTATTDFVCHDFAWTNGQPLEGHHPQSVDPAKIVASPEAFGFQDITPLTRFQTPDLAQGDVVVYYGSEGTITHSGLVVKVENGVVYMKSKDRSNSIFTHQLTSPDGKPNYFKDTMGQGGLQYFRPGPGANPFQATPSANAPSGVGPAPAPPTAP